MSRRVVVYADTNVLYPYYVSDLLLWLASDGLIRLMWTQYLVNEVIDVVPRRRLTRVVGRDERAVRSQWEAACAHLQRDEVSEAQWLTRMSLTAGPDADDHRALPRELALPAPRFAELAARASNTRLSRLTRLRVRLSRLNVHLPVVGCPRRQSRDWGQRRSSRSRFVTPSFCRIAVRAWCPRLFSSVPRALPH